MKLKELINEPELAVRVESALQSMDWEWDIDMGNSGRLELGAKQLDEVKVMIGALYTTSPQLAETMWGLHCPYAQPGSLAAFLKR